MASQEHMDVENPVENGKPKKTKSILAHFDKLSHDQPKIQQKHIMLLLKQLAENRDEKAEQEVKYALGRLIRGLGSSKIQTKTGYFTTLVALLNLASPSIDEIFALIDKELHKAGSNSKSENADIYSGQVLVCGAILRSTLYRNLEVNEKEKVLNLLISAGKQRDYLTLASHVFIVDLYEKIDSEEFQQVLFHQIKAEAFKPWQEQNLDSFYLLTQTLRHFPDSINSKFLKTALGTVEVFCAANLPQICTILTAIPRLASLKHPIFTWTIEEVAKSGFITLFFQTLDSFLAKSNRNKLFVVAKLLTGVVEKLEDISQLPKLLTDNFMQHTIQMLKSNAGRNKDGDFRASAHALFGALHAKLKMAAADDSSKVRLEVIRRLLFYPGTFIFEKVTKTKLIQNITQCLNTGEVSELATIYQNVILGRESRKIGQNSEESYWLSDRVYASHLLVKLLNHGAMLETDGWKCQQLTFLMTAALYDRDEISANLASSLKETFFSALALRSTKLTELKTILFALNAELQQSMDKIAVNTLTADDLSLFQRSLDFAGAMETKNSAGGNKRKLVFAILFLHMNLQLFNSNATLARDTLNELFSCYERAKKIKKTRNGGKNADDPEWIEVVVDLFLNLLSHNSHLLRNVIGCVFPHLCEFLNANAIHQILSVLDPENEDNPLSANKSESSEDEEETDEDEQTDEEAESDEESDQEGEETNEDDTVNDRLRLALHQLLGNHMDDDTQSVDLEDLDEEEGEKLDLALSNAFKRFKPNLGRSKKQSKDQETLTHFRIRVLDLIDIYLNSNPSLILSLEIMLPLLKTLEFSVRDEHQKPLKDRVEHCLKKLTALKKFATCEEVSQVTLVELLQSLLDKGTKNTTMVQDMAEKISDCCVFVINCSQQIPALKKKSKKNVLDVISESLTTFFDRRDCLIPYVLFKNVMQLNWSGALDLVPVLTKYVFSDSIRPFRKHQALELLRLFCKNNRLQQAHKELLERLQEPLEQFLQDSINFFEDFAQNFEQKNVREKFFNGLFGLLSDLKTSKLVETGQLWTLLGEKVLEARSHIILGNSTKQVFNKLCRLLNVTQQVQIKQSAVKLDKNEQDEEVNSDLAREKKKKKKSKGRNKDSAKLKKESKLLRLEGLSNGFKRKNNTFDAEHGKRMKSDSVD